MGNALKKLKKKKGYTLSTSTSPHASPVASKAKIMIREHGKREREKKSRSSKYENCEKKQKTSTISSRRIYTSRKGGGCDSGDPSSDEEKKRRHSEGKGPEEDEETEETDEEEEKKKDRRKLKKKKRKGTKAVNKRKKRKKRKKIKTKEIRAPPITGNSQGRSKKGKKRRPKKGKKRRRKNEIENEKDDDLFAFFADGLPPQVVSNDSNDGQSHRTQVNIQSLQSSSVEEEEEEEEEEEDIYEGRNSKSNDNIGSNYELQLKKTKFSAPIFDSNNTPPPAILNYADRSSKPNNVMKTVNISPELPIKLLDTPPTIGLDYRRKIFQLTSKAMIRNFMCENQNCYEKFPGIKVYLNYRTRSLGVNFHVNAPVLVLKFSPNTPVYYPLGTNLKFVPKNVIAPKKEKEIVEEMMNLFKDQDDLESGDDDLDDLDDDDLDDDDLEDEINEESDDASDGDYYEGEDEDQDELEKEEENEGEGEEENGEEEAYDRLTQYVRNGAKYWAGFNVDLSKICGKYVGQGKFSKVFGEIKELILFNRTFFGEERKSEMSYDVYPNKRKKKDFNIHDVKIASSGLRNNTTQVSSKSNEEDAKKEKMKRLFERMKRGTRMVQEVTKHQSKQNENNFSGICSPATLIGPRAIDFYLRVTPILENQFQVQYKDGTEACIYSPVTPETRVDAVQFMSSTVIQTPPHIEKIMKSWKIHTKQENLQILDDILFSSHLNYARKKETIYDFIRNKKHDLPKCSISFILIQFPITRRWLLYKSKSTSKVRTGERNRAADSVVNQTARLDISGDFPVLNLLFVARKVAGTSPESTLKDEGSYVDCIAAILLLKLLDGDLDRKEVVKILKEKRNKFKDHEFDWKKGSNGVKFFSYRVGKQRRTVSPGQVIKKIRKILHLQGNLIGTQVKFSHHNFKAQKLSEIVFSSCEKRIKEMKTPESLDIQSIVDRAKKRMKWEPKSKASMTYHTVHLDRLLKIDEESMEEDIKETKRIIKSARTPHFQDLVVGIMFCSDSKNVAEFNLNDLYPEGWKLDYFFPRIRVMMTLDLVNLPETYMILKRCLRYILREDKLEKAEKIFDINLHKDVSIWGTFATIIVELEPGLVGFFWENFPLASVYEESIKMTKIIKDPQTRETLRAKCSTMKRHLLVQFCVFLSEHFYALRVFKRETQKDDILEAMSLFGAWASFLFQRIVFRFRDICGEKDSFDVFVGRLEVDIPPVVGQKMNVIFKAIVQMRKVVSLYPFGVPTESFKREKDTSKLISERLLNEIREMENSYKLIRKKRGKKFRRK